MPGTKGRAGAGGAAVATIKGQTGSGRGEHGRRQREGVPEERKDQRRRKKEREGVDLRGATVFDLHVCRCPLSRGGGMNGQKRGPDRFLLRA